MSADRLDRLERAFDAYLEWASGDTGIDREAFLKRHDTVRDLLEPMLEGDGGQTGEGDEAGRVLGDFRIVREIGRGGMGVVYEARQLSLRRTVALKLLPPSFALSPRAVTRFKREAEIMGRLDHPGLVKVFAVGQIGGSFYYAMELVDGVSLYDVLDAIRGDELGRLTGDDVIRRAVPSTGETSAFWRRGYVRVAVELAHQIAIALDHAHRAGVVHRDVKPANILVRADGTAVLTDFGLARQDDLPTVTLSGDFAGTPSYVAPEQARGQRVDARADVFALGVTLYELLTHRCPFEGDTTQQVLHRIQTKEPVDPSRLHRGLSLDLVAIVLRALEKDPKHRYQSAGAFAADLRAFLDHRAVEARRVSPVTRAVRWARREPLRAGLLASLVIGLPLVTGLGGYLLANADNIRAGVDSRRAAEVDRQVATGFLQMVSDDIPGAKRFFDAALELDDRHVEAILGVVMARSRLGDDEGALELLDGRLPELPDAKALRLARKIIEHKLAGTDPSVEFAGVSEPLELFLVGTTKLEAGGETRNNALLGEATRLFELVVTRAPRARVLYHLYWLQAARQWGNRDAAVAAADAMELLWPDDEHILLTFGYALNDLDPERAIASLQKVFARAETGSFVLDDDNERRALLHLGNAYDAAERYDEAIKTYQRLITANPEFPKAHTNVASTYQKLDRLEEAEASYRRAVEVDPDYTWGWFALGRFYKAVRRDADAIDALRRCARLEPNMPACRFNLAYCLKRSGNPDEAAEHYRAAVELDPTLWAGWLNLGNILKRRGELADAEHAYRQAAAVNPGEIDIHVSLGSACRLQGKRAEAIEALTRALQIDPDHERAKREMALAQQLLDKER